jgi:hypothetical protein
MQYRCSQIIDDLAVADGSVTMKLRTKGHSVECQITEDLWTGLR